MWGISKIFCNFAAENVRMANGSSLLPFQKTSKNAVMTTFIGNIEGRLDDKGRIFVPAIYRKILAELGAKRLVLRRDPSNACLIFYPEHVWNSKVEALRNSLDEWNPDDQLLLMQFVGDAEFLEMDNQGRVLLQKRNLQQIDAEQDVLFVGMIDRFALWAPAVYEKDKLSQTDFSTQLREKMQKQNSLPL